MTAPVFIFPIVPRQNFCDPAWREQNLRECRAQIGWQLAPPPRTRPLLAVDNNRLVFRMVAGRRIAVSRAVAESLDVFHAAMVGLRDVFADDIQPSQR